MAAQTVDGWRLRPLIGIALMVLLTVAVGGGLSAIMLLV